jgi:protease I
MPTVWMIIAPEQFRDEELNVPRACLTQAGFTVKVASTQTGEATGMLGAVEPVTHLLEDILPTASELAGVVVVGGYGSVQHLWNHSGLHQLLQQAAQAQKVVAAICVSPVVLAKAGLLEGQTASVWDMPESQEAFAQAGVTYTPEPVTVSGRFVTADAPNSAQAFGEALLQVLKALPVIARS